MLGVWSDWIPEFEFVACICMLNSYWVDPGLSCSGSKRGVSMGSESKSDNDDMNKMKNQALIDLEEEEGEEELESCPSYKLVKFKLYETRSVCPLTFICSIFSLPLTQLMLNSDVVLDFWSGDYLPVAIVSDPSPCVWFLKDFWMSGELKYRHYWLRIRNFVDSACNFHWSIFWTFPLCFRFYS